jgi:hypothetical protein
MLISDVRRLRRFEFLLNSSRHECFFIFMSNQLVASRLSEFILTVCHDFSVPLFKFG